VSAARRSSGTAYYSAKNLGLDIDLLIGTAIVAATGIGFFVEAATLAVLSASPNCCPRRRLRRSASRWAT